jgi:hypothetical protein
VKKLRPGLRYIGNSWDFQILGLESILFISSSFVLQKQRYFRGAKGDDAALKTKKPLQAGQGPARAQRQGLALHCLYINTKKSVCNPPKRTNLFFPGLWEKRESMCNRFR